MAATSSQKISANDLRWHGVPGTTNVRERRRRDGSFEYLAKFGTKTKMLDARNRTEMKRELPGVLALLNGSTGVTVGDRSVTLGPAEQSWYEREQGPNARLAASTRDRNHGVLVKHVIPTLKPHTRVGDLTSAHVRHMIDKFVSQGMPGGSVRVHVSALSTVLDFCVRNGNLDRNVVRDLVRGDLPSSKRLTDPRYLEFEQFTELLDGRVCEDDTKIAGLSYEVRPIGAALFYAAGRVQETLDLRWRNIDFENDEIDFSEAATKTAASKQRVPMHPALKEILREHRADQGRIGVHRIAADALVFQTATGRPVSRRNVLRAIANAGVRLGFSPSVKASECPPDRQPIGPHDLRHSLAANVRRLGFTESEIARLLRHADANVTRAMYGGLTDDHVAEIGTKLAAVGGGGRA